MPLSKTQCAALLERLPAARQAVTDVLWAPDVPVATRWAIRNYLLGRPTWHFTKTVPLATPRLPKVEDQLLMVHVGFNEVLPLSPGWIWFAGSIVRCSLNDPFRYDVGVAKVLLAYLATHHPKWGRDRRKKFIDLNTPVLMTAIAKAIVEGDLPTQEELA